MSTTLDRCTAVALWFLSEWWLRLLTATFVAEHALCRVVAAQHLTPGPGPGLFSLGRERVPHH